VPTQLLHTGQLPNDAVAYPAIGQCSPRGSVDPDHDLPSYVTVSPRGGFGNNWRWLSRSASTRPMAISGISETQRPANLTIVPDADRRVAATTRKPGGNCSPSCRGLCEAPWRIRNRRPRRRLPKGSA